MFIYSFIHRTSLGPLHLLGGTLSLTVAIKNSFQMLVKGAYSVLQKEHADLKEGLLNVIEIEEKIS